MTTFNPITFHEHILNTIHETTHRYTEVPLIEIHFGQFATWLHLDRDVDYNCRTFIARTTREEKEAIFTKSYFNARVFTNFTNMLAFVKPFDDAFINRSKNIAVLNIHDSSQDLYVVVEYAIDPTGQNPRYAPLGDRLCDDEGIAYNNEQQQLIRQLFSKRD